MARPNFQQGKRQREMARKLKQVRKTERRQAKRKNSPAIAPGADSEPPAPAPESKP